DASRPSMTNDEFRMTKKQSFVIDRAVASALTLDLLEDAEAAGDEDVAITHAGAGEVGEHVVEAVGVTHIERRPADVETRARGHPEVHAIHLGSDVALEAGRSTQQKRRLLLRAQPQTHGRTGKEVEPSAADA